MTISGISRCWTACAGAWKNNIILGGKIMVFTIECIVACVLFTALIEIATLNRREVFVNDYPPIVTDKLRQIGLIAEKPPAKKVILFAS